MLSGLNHLWFLWKSGKTHQIKKKLDIHDWHVNRTHEGDDKIYHANVVYSCILKQKQSPYPKEEKKNLLNNIRPEHTLCIISRIYTGTVLVNVTCVFGMGCTVCFVYITKNV